MGRRSPSALNQANRSSNRVLPARPGSSKVVSAGQSKSGVHPPQQARSRAALQRLLASAEVVLVNEGLEDFTIARVAEHAGVSVGGIYRRFASKEQLIDAVKQAFVERLEQAVADALDKAERSVSGVVDAFIAALSETLDQSGRVIPAILAGGGRVEPPEQGLRAVTGLQQRFLDAAAPHQGQIRHPDPVAALNLAFFSAIGTGAHRAAISPWLHDGLTWGQWAREIAHMMTAYLISEHQSSAPAT